jgi:hypothetical protein
MITITYLYVLDPPPELIISDEDEGMLLCC